MRVLIKVFLVSLAVLFTACDSGSTIDAKSLSKTKIEAEKKGFLTRIRQQKRNLLTLTILHLKRLPRRSQLKCCHI